MLIKQIIPPIIYNVYRNIATKYKKKYTIGKYRISIPPNHALPTFQKYHKLYDRFLPVLAKHISSEKIIIDVGANIGDTIISLIQNCSNPAICIEPSDLFYSYLVNNLAKIDIADSKRIQMIKKMIGTGNIKGNLEHSKGGTATVLSVNCWDSKTHTPLDSIIDEKNEVVLLKVDTDGFDFDVICSSPKLLANSEPILFWENEISYEFQIKGFNELYFMLEKIGYKYVYIFDNFGNLLINEIGFNSARYINEYLYSMKMYNCTRTFNYIDIMASTDRYHDNVVAAINEYKNEWITSKFK